MRLIDADALIDFIDCGHLRNPLESCFSERDVVDMLESRPTISAAPVVRGEWEDIPNRYVCVAGDRPYHGNATSCSVCHEVNPNAFKTNYCPNCGAKMESEAQ